jgi:hypothetical protein
VGTPDIEKSIQDKLEEFCIKRDKSKRNRRKANIFRMKIEKTFVTLKKIYKRREVWNGLLSQHTSDSLLFFFYQNQRSKNMVGMKNDKHRFNYLVRM